MRIDAIYMQIKYKMMILLGLGGSKTAYLAACDKLKSHTVILYNLKKHLITVLLTRDDGTEISPSSRKIFIEKFRKFVMDISDLKVSIRCRFHCSFLNPNLICFTQ